MLKRLSLLLLCLAAVPAAAADYPSRAIKMVVPFAPGGGTDVLGRIIAQRLSDKWGQPVVVENQPGASGGIGTKAFVKAEPDGYTLLMASTGALMAASAALAPEGQFDVDKFFAPITVVAAPPYLLVINPKVQANSRRRTDQARGGKAEGAVVRVFGHRRRLASVGRAVREGRACRAAARALQGHGSCGHRSSGRAHRHDVLALDHGAGACRGRHAQGARHHRRQALEILPRRADGGGRRLCPATRRSAGSACWRRRIRRRTSSTSSTRRWSRSWARRT